MIDTLKEGVFVMLVSHLREVLKGYKEEDLRLLILEMYKSMPKKFREDKDIDLLLQDVEAYMGRGKIERTQEIQKDIEHLKTEIDLFVDYAYKQYYFAPNSFVHKKDRPKWRFKVKAYIKDLQTIPVESREGKTSTDLLEKFYKMLDYACSYYIFNTDNPFRSVGIEQTTFLDMIIARKLGSGISKESVKSVVALVINSGVDRETLHSSLICVLIKNLKTSDYKEIAIEQCMALKTELEKNNSSKKTRNADFSEYQRKERLNNLTEMVFRINIVLCEYEKAIDYFNKNHIERNKEISLYILLELLLEYKLKEYWLKEYDDAIKRGVIPRKSLQKTYMYIQENDKLPEWVYE